MRCCFHAMRGDRAPFWVSEHKQYSLGSTRVSAKYQTLCHPLFAALDRASQVKSLRPDSPFVCKRSAELGAAMAERTRRSTRIPRPSGPPTVKPAPLAPLMEQVGCWAGGGVKLSPPADTWYGEPCEGLKGNA
jgi:hypothetical protein